MRYRIMDATVDANLFSMEIEFAISHRYLRAGDVLILDNAAIHTGKDNSVIKEWLWEEHMVLVLFLPARAPEWNPIELMWNCLTQRLKFFDLSSLNGTHQVVWQLQKSSTRSPMMTYFNSTRRVGCSICMDIKGR